MKKKQNQENYLERIPKRASHLTWSEDAGKVTLAVENRGWMNRICQKLFRKPPVSYIHLDETGSFLWPLLNGEENLIALGEHLKEAFGDAAEPLYERLAQYLRILDSYGFITWVSKEL